MAATGSLEQAKVVKKSCEITVLCCSNFLCQFSCLRLCESIRAWRKKISQFCILQPMAMCTVCTVTPGCHWLRSEHNGKLKPWCCHRCLRTQGRKHNPYCQSRKQTQEGHSHHRRSRSPRRHDVVRFSPPAMVRSTDLHLHRTIITCGKLAARGKFLLRANPQLKNPRRCYDVTDALHDPLHPRDAPDVTYAETQRRIVRLEGFVDVHTWILSTLLRERYTVVICNHGRHRSVGAAELAVQDLQRM